MQVIILCGGKGTRSYPFTELYPKVMMPIAGSPVITHLMRIYAEQGFTDFVLAAGHRQEILRDYFDARFHNWNVRIVDTGAESDTGERLKQCLPYVGERFFATYGDGLGDIDLHGLLNYHKRTRALATVTAVPLRSQYGAVIFDRDGRIDRFDEKPIIPDQWINAGFFVFDRRAFDHLAGTNLEAHLLPSLAKKGELFAYSHHGFWKSMDTSKDQQELEKLADGSRAPWMGSGRHLLAVVGQ